MDRIYIGHIEGIRKIALSGVGLCFPIILLIFAFTSLTGAEGAPLAYIEMGKGDSPLIGGQIFYREKLDHLRLLQYVFTYN